MHTLSHFADTVCMCCKAKHQNKGEQRVKQLCASDRFRLDILDILSGMNTCGMALDTANIVDVRRGTKMCD